MTKPANPLAAAQGAATAHNPLGEYMTDAVQRTVLFWDVLRQRSDQYYAQREKDVPHVLSFDAELVLDARTFARPVNYLLVRIKPPQGVVIDPQKRPFVVVDPRAGHGPGIGGFKADSEIGVAMKAGHPCYFVGFTPEPMPGQTIEDIIYAEVAFLEKVIALHPEAEGKPCVIGNCQAGWAVMMVAAIRPDLFGPIIVPGSPLSYWAGVDGQNPMRYTGGLAGGSWMTALAGDLGNGKFDGGYLVENFENQNPANTLWTKHYNLWSKVDTEGPRYIEFEKWWGGHVNLNAEEIQWIVDKLFVGNRLATAEIVTSRGDRIDLRNIRSPIICFCSKGDNITPPQQALGWIVDLYAKDDDIRACGQTIVYAVHERIGHLGIFVSGGVAKKEHQEFASNIDLIDVLPPGLYEAVMTPKTADARTRTRSTATGSCASSRARSTTCAPSCSPTPRWSVASPPCAGCRRSTSACTARCCSRSSRRRSTSRAPSGCTSSTTPSCRTRSSPTRNPLMQPLAQLAEQVREQRSKAAPDNPLLAWQAMVSDQIVAALDGWRDVQEASVEQIFLAIYGSPVLQAMVGVGTGDEPPRRGPGMEPERLAFVSSASPSSRPASPRAARARRRCARCSTSASPARAPTSARSTNCARSAPRTRACRWPSSSSSLREQYFSLLLDREAALAAIPKMLPADAADRRQVLRGRAQGRSRRRAR